MMKKLMILSLVLGMATIASAGLVVEIGEVVDVQWDVPLTNYDLIVMVTEGELAFGDVAFNPDLAFDFAPKHVTDPAPHQLRLSASQFLSGPVGPGSLFTVGYEGIGTFEVVNAFNGEVLGTFVIPEPMTMGLLGLGALFLRRRK